MSAEADREIPGWYGKLPSLGDFVSRRLPPDFIQIWDAWLQDRLQTTRTFFGDGWRECYLTAPIWRFLLLGGVVGQSGWAGILMPSVDRVGRHFPLTVAVELSSYTAAAHTLFDAADWFATLEDAALSALDVTRGPDDLDAALATSAFTPPPNGDVLDSLGVLVPLPAVDALGTVAKAQALRAWSIHAGWKGVWWTRGRVGHDPLMLACNGLPSAEEFAWLLQSRSATEPRRGAAAVAGA